MLGALRRYLGMLHPFDVHADHHPMLAVVKSSASPVRGHWFGTLSMDHVEWFGSSRSALQCAPPRLRGERKLALAPVTRDGDALAFASRALHADKEVVLAAVVQPQPPSRVGGATGGPQGGVDNAGGQLQHPADEN